ncbi:50S ribosomal protein L29 [Rubinisphaera sp. JC750]|uniref:50S ribosomal protein L29 n=1 Tax=Rubinisphaera sp. JC750 TaxID=2898658 RepID=UPI001F0194A7|nr:50S ribosomal protein L29 [Rubinisphaera sp. JC750]
MSKPAELRELSDEQLNFTLQETQKQLFELQFQAATEKLDTPSRKKELRREIARIKTIQHQRAAANGETQAPAAEQQA